ncbi:MAG TPA: RHS repeat-associated core domain-containing protein [Acidobacteriota bacterium]|nr:RHS repeat-associated core domain-containing protein [Acidobacteriota bacterium]HQM63333.1 RHS repeat-associated core domain-containing protein [Acidobacteriota bacterium]
MLRKGSSGNEVGVPRANDFELIQYGYDALDRLVLADYDWKADETFSYDPVGNRTADAGHPVWHYDAANQLLAYGAGPHDPVGQTPPDVPAVAFTYNANGSTTSKAEPAAGITDQYGYNFDNRMSEVRRDGELVARYSYDHLSQRTRKDLFTDGAPTGTTWFVYGHEGLLAEYDETGALIRKYAWQPEYPWGTNALYQRHQSGMIHHHLNDQLATTQTMIDDDYTATWSADWNSLEPEMQLQFSENNLRFPGQYHDAETGSFYNWHRYFDPRSGRYWQADPIGFHGGYNRYLYSRNNPIRTMDFSGLKCCDANGKDLTDGGKIKCYIVCAMAWNINLGARHCWLEWGPADPTGDAGNQAWGMYSYSNPSLNQTGYDHKDRAGFPHPLSDEDCCKLLKNQPPSDSQGPLYGFGGTCNSAIQKYLRGIGADIGYEPAPFEGMIGWEDPPDPWNWVLESILRRHIYF